VIIIKRKYEKEKEMNLSNEKYQCDLVVSCDDGKQRREPKRQQLQSVLFSIFNSFDFSTKPWIRDQ
jgi:hypothetical protein